MSYVIESAYSSALLSVACGETYGRTRADLFDSFPALTTDDIADILADAYRDALAQGIERDDIDESWSAR